MKRLPSAHSIIETSTNFATLKILQFLLSESERSLQLQLEITVILTK